MNNNDTSSGWPKLDFSPSESDATLLDEQLEAYNARHAGSDNKQPICIVARGDEAGIVGGIKGVIVMRWLYISTLWVAEGSRGSGIGSRLMDEVERIAVEHDCVGACLTSFEFQAPEFYKSRGYKCVGQIEDYPPGSVLYFLSRRFTNK